MADGSFLLPQQLTKHGGCAAPAHYEDQRKAGHKTQGVQESFLSYLHLGHINIFEV